MEHTFLIDNYVLVLERKKIKFKKKAQKISYQPNTSMMFPRLCDVLSMVSWAVYSYVPL